MTNEDVTHNDDKAINYQMSERNELEEWFDENIKPYKGYKGSEDIFRNIVSKWEKPISATKKEENYNSLLNLEKEGDREFEQKNYGTAWNRYSLASIYYPSPRLLVKAGDAQLFHIINNFESICDCETSLNVEGRITQRERNGVKHSFLSTYGVAVDFNDYPKTDYHDDQSLSQNEVQEVKKKINCLNKVLDFEGNFADTAILKQCI